MISVPYVLRTHCLLLVTLTHHKTEMQWPGFKSGAKESCILLLQQQQQQNRAANRAANTAKKIKASQDQRMTLKVEVGLNAT